MKPVVLHIAAHYGGGIGAVVMNYLKHAVKTSKYEHRLICLEKVTDELVTFCNRLNVELIQGRPTIGHLSDVSVHLYHWWNRPSISKEMTSYTVPNRVVWSHVSGLYEPHRFTKELLDYPDQMVFTTPLSMGHPDVLCMKRPPRVIWSTRGVEGFDNIQRAKQNAFTVGYVGTTEYKKMHPQFIEICRKIKERIPEARFIVCGGDKGGMIAGIDFQGTITNVRGRLASFDVFGYPLQPKHFGTCEQALGEAMSAGLPIVVLGNPTEWLIIDHNVTGLIASTVDEYVKYVEKLFYSSKLRKFLGKNAREAAKHRYSTARMVNDWEEVLDETSK
jgi:glycosyltransferase involved in cell wall biosynthesis